MIQDEESRSFAITVLPPTQDGARYDIIATYATLPTLYAGLNLSASQNEKFIWFGRGGTLSVEVLEADSKNVISEYIGDSSKLALNVANEIKSFCYDALQKDENAKFRLYVDDLDIGSKLRRLPK